MIDLYPGHRWRSRDHYYSWKEKLHSEGISFDPFVVLRVVEAGSHAVDDLIASSLFKVLNARLAFVRNHIFLLLPKTSPIFSFSHPQTQSVV